MNYVYSWNPGVPQDLSGIDPNAFATELETIEKEYGAVTSDVLAKRAKDPDHVAHGFIYHVGQRRAATLHYEQRAGLLLRALQVTVVEEPARTVRARFAVPPDVDTPGAGGRDRFLSAQEIASRQDLRDLHRQSLLRRMNLLRQELIEFDEFAAVVAAIEEVLDKAADG